MRIYVLAIFTILAVLTIVSPCHAQVPCDGCGGVGSLLEALDSASSSLEEAETVLRSKPRTEWTRDDIFYYQAYSLAVVYYAYYVELIANGHEHFIDASGICGLQSINKWPLNPFNEWEPIEVYDNMSEYRPGDIVRQITPESETAFDGRSVSFLMYVLGPDPEWQPDLVAPVVKGSECWAAPPKGAVLSMGIQVETKLEHDKRIEILLKILGLDNESENSTE